MLVARAGRSQAEIRLGLGLARPAASRGLQLAAGKMETLAIAETARQRREGLHRAMEAPNCCGETALLTSLTLLSCGSRAAQAVRPNLRRACGWRWLQMAAEIVLWLQVQPGAVSAACLAWLLPAFGLFLTCSSPSGESISR